MDDQDLDGSLTLLELDAYTDFFKGEKTMNLSQLQDAVTAAVAKGHGPGLLYSTSRKGFHLTVQFLLSAGVDVNTSKDILLCSPIHYATLCDQAQTVKVLLEYGASEHVKNIRGRLPLHVAALNGSIQVLEHFVHFELAYVEDGYGKTPISIAIETGRSLFFTRMCHRIHSLGHSDSRLLKSVFLSALSHRSMFGDICQILIMEDRLGLVKFLMDNFGTSLTGSESKILYIAAQHGTSEMVKLICDFENNVDLLNDEGNTPLHLAVYNPRLSTEMVICLAAQSQNINNFRECKTVLHAATQSGKLSLCTALIKWCSKLCEICDEHGRLPVHTAAMAKSEQVLALLISNTNDVNVYDADGKTPVYYALNNASFNHMQVVEQFLQKDNINNNNSNNTTMPCDSFTKRRMLHVSAALGLNQACKAITNLVQYMNFDLDFNDKLPIEYAFKNCSMDTVEYMMVAVTTYHQRKDTSPEIKALIKDACIHIMHMIIEDDADMTEKLLDMLLEVLHCDSIINKLLYKATSRGRTAIVMKLLAAGANIDAIDPSTKETPLHAAIKNRYLGTVFCLIAHNALENVVDSQQNYPLHIAAQCGSLEALQHLQTSLNNPNILNAKNAFGDTPLLCAIKDSPAHVECVRELLRHRADVDIPASDGSLPIELGPSQSSRTATSIFCIISQYSDNIDSIIEGFRRLQLYGCISAQDYSAVIETLLQIIERTERKNILCLFDRILDECSWIENWDFQSCFLRALIEKDAVGIIQRLLEYAPGEQHDPKKHKFLEKQDLGGLLPMHIAAESGSDKIFQLFVAFTPADLLQTRTSDRLTVFHLAVQNKHISDAVICSHIMRNRSMLHRMKSFLKPNLLSLAIECGRTVVIETLAKEFSLLISKERDVPNDITPLEHYSVCGKSTKLYEMLIQHQASCLEGRHKAMLYCLRNDSSTCVCFLKKNFENDVDCFTFGGVRSEESILHAAVKKGNFDVCECLLSVKPMLANLADRVGNLPLFYALQNQSNALVLLLLQHTPDPNGMHTASALDRAMQNALLPLSTIKLLLTKGLRCYDSDFRKATVRKHYDESDSAWLLERCAAFHSDTCNPLILSDTCHQMHHVMLSGDNAAIQKAAGAINDLNQGDILQRTPLHLAVTKISVTLDSIRALVENGAWVDAVGGVLKETPLLMALEAKRWDVCRYLLAQGAEPCISNQEGVSPLHIALCNGYYGLFIDMLHVTRDLNKCDTNGNSLLRVAIRDQNVPYVVVENLVNLGADIRFHTSYIHPRHRSTTPSLSAIRGGPGLLHMGILAKKLGECKLLCAKEATFVTSYIADINPIHVLISLNDSSFASSLLEHLVTTDEIIDEREEQIDDYSPMDLAAMQGSAELVKLLIAHGADVDIGVFIGYRMILERNIWTPEVVVALVQGGIDLSYMCGDYDCTQCDNSADYVSQSAFICSMLQQTESDILGGYHFVCHVAIQLGLPILDHRLESEECGTVLGRDVQLALLQMVTSPRPLTLLCRDFIRDHLHENSAKHIVERIDSVALPELVKSFLKLEDVDISTIQKSLDVRRPVPPLNFLSRYAIPVVQSDEEMQDSDEESMSDASSTSSWSSHEESDAESDH